MLEGTKRKNRAGNVKEGRENFEKRGEMMEVPALTNSMLDF